MSIELRPFDEGWKAFCDGRGPESAKLDYREGTESYHEFQQGWLAASYMDTVAI